MPCLAFEFAKTKFEQMYANVWVLALPIRPIDENYRSKLFCMTTQTAKARNPFTWCTNFVQANFCFDLHQHLELQFRIRTGKTILITFPPLHSVRKYTRRSIAKKLELCQVEVINSEPSVHCFSSFPSFLFPPN